MKVVTFGEIMLRLKTPENFCIMQSDGFETSYGGAEANVAFVHGLINEFDPQKTVDFAISAGVLKLMIQHDFNVVTQEDVFKVMNSKSTNLFR
ncbi:hypothetical protein [Holdemanella biformis]|uniref:hypothetical protein n=1 Tax=Holdemanella biformis TaxID=1735 RepID=UPI0022E368A6|nr:hypothetical protein [Holdemanella biformis]